MNRFEIKFTQSTCTRFTIEPERRFTVEQIIEKLNSGEAIVSGDSIVKPSPPPYEGSTVLGKIVATRPEANSRNWEIVPATADNEQSDGADSVQQAYDRGTRATG